MSADELEALAAEVGAADLFLFEQVAPGRLVNVEGYGRGKGWAGNIEVQPEVEPWLAEAIDRGMARTAFGVPTRVFGPYWAAEASAAWTGEHLVVFGGPGTADLDDARLMAAGRRAGAVAAEIPVAKRLADDLEVAQASLAVATLAGGSLERVAEGIAGATAEALGCEFGAVVLFGPPLRVHVADRGWRPAASEDEVVSALTPIAHAAASGLQVEQDLDSSPLGLRPLSFADGLVSRCSLGFGTNGSLGMITVAHAGDRPRGFTSLCQRIMVSIGETAEPVLQGALRERPLVAD
jgi:hypothetical protein